MNKLRLLLFMCCTLLLLCFVNNPICNAQDVNFKDSRDQHEYKYVKIGTQTWMAENLAWLPAVSPSKDWSPTSPFYYVYKYEGSSASVAKATSNYTSYGVLYNWPAAKKACPSGWHLPSEQEWMTLEIYLGMSKEELNRGMDYSKTGLVGGKLKESGTSRWKSPNIGANNSSGFTALPGGRSSNGSFADLGLVATFWSSSESTESKAMAMYWNLSYDRDGTYRSSIYRDGGRSIRCLKDN